MMLARWVWFRVWDLGLGFWAFGSWTRLLFPSFRRSALDGELSGFVGASGFEFGFVSSTALQFVGGAMPKVRHVQRAPTVVALQGSYLRALRVFASSQQRWMRFIHAFFGVTIEFWLGSDATQHTLSPIITHRGYTLFSGEPN